MDAFEATQNASSAVREREEDGESLFNEAIFICAVQTDAQHYLSTSKMNEMGIVALPFILCY